jgi:GDP-L-fucose synthase
MITGGGGMVGKNILEHTAMNKHEPFAPLRSELDLSDFAAVEKYMGRIRPDLVIHAAGKVGGIQANMREPVNFLLENMDMGRNVVWAARKCGVRRLINLGSSCMYPRNAVNPLKEEMILQGELEPTNEGYALAKIAVSRLCSYISRESSEFSYKTIVPCNLYGRWDKFSPEHSHMIPAVIRKLHLAKLNGDQTVEIWGDGTARREFMYAGDVAACIHRAVEEFDTLPELMNVGLGNDYSINDYYQAAAEVVGYKGSFTHDLTKPVGMACKLVDISRMTTWGWKPATSLKDGLAATYEFFKANNGDKK